MDGDGNVEFHELLQFILEYQNRLQVMNSTSKNKF